VPGAALWALLPLVANTLLGLDALGYGVLLGALGVGAVSGAAVLPRIVAKLSPSRLVLAAGLVFGAATAVSALVPNPVVVVVVLVPAGLAWLCMLATMNGNLSMFLPGWVRARGLSIDQMVFAGGQALAGGWSGAGHGDLHRSGRERCMVARDDAGRLTGSDRNLELAALKWADGGPAEVLHLLPVRPPELRHPTTSA
jgi:MFS family permease